jgi:hypothetical protein
MTADEKLIEADEKLIEAVEGLAFGVVGLTSQALAETGQENELTLAQWRVLVILGQGSMRVGAIADRIGSSLASARRLVARMEARIRRDSSRPQRPPRHAGVAGTAWAGSAGANDRDSAPPDRRSSCPRADPRRREPRAGSGRPGREVLSRRTSRGRRCVVGAPGSRPAPDPPPVALPVLPASVGGRYLAAPHYVRNGRELQPSPASAHWR